MGRDRTMAVNPAQIADTLMEPVADAVISFAETHMQPLTEWQRRLIRWAFRGDGRQPLVVEGRYIGGTAPSRRADGDDVREVIGYRAGGQLYHPADVEIVVLQPHGILGIFTDKDEARRVAQATGNVLTHVPADGDYRQQ